MVDGCYCLFFITSKDYRLYNTSTGPSGVILLESMIHLKIFVKFFLNFLLIFLNEFIMKFKFNSLI